MKTLTFNVPSFKDLKDKVTSKENQQYAKDVVKKKSATLLKGIAKQLNKAANKIQ